MLTLALALAASQSVTLPPHFYDLIEMSERPITAYLPVDPSERRHFDGDALVLYINRFGGSYTCGDSLLDNNAATNRSSIACAESDNTADITPYQGSDADWGEIMTCLGDLFSPFNLPVTDVEPLGDSGIEYVEAVVGGSPDQAGMEQGVGGVAPFDSSDCGVIPGAIVYAFSDVYGNDTRAICETAAQEIAHAFGLDHAFLCEDPMTYLGGCGEKAFVDEYVPCGEFEPRACQCATPTQNSVQSMLQLFGAADGTVFVPPVDQAPPLLDLVSPQDGAILTANSAIDIVIDAVDDVGLTVVELEWDFSGERMFCPAAGGSYTCVRDEAGRYTWTVNVGIGNRTYRAHVRDVAGNEITSSDVSVWLSPDGSGPPVDTVGPTIVLGSPLSGSVLPAETPFDVVATFLDDNGVARAELNWPRRGEDRWVGCPYEDERMTCVVEGKNTYRWTVNRAREGERTIGLRATDVVGNSAEIGDVLLNVVEGTPAIVSDGNDTIDEAKTVKCGDSVTVDGYDADWFTVDAPVGDTVTVTTQDEGFQMLATDGKQIVGEPGRSVKHVVIAGAPLSVAVSPPAQLGGSTTLTVECVSPPEEPKPQGCAYAGFPSLLALLGVALRLRRRS